MMPQTQNTGTGHLRLQHAAPCCTSSCLMSDIRPDKRFEQVNSQKQVAVFAQATHTSHPHDSSENSGTDAHLNRQLCLHHPAGQSRSCLPTLKPLRIRLPRLQAALHRHYCPPSLCLQHCNILSYLQWQHTHISPSAALASQHCTLPQQQRQRYLFESS